MGNYSDLVVDLFMNEKIYLIKGLSLKKIASVLGMSYKEMSRTFEQEMGLKFKEMVSVWRLMHARNLFLRYKLSSKKVWRLSGFDSYKDFERNWNSIVF